jgi:hypothetical protein
MSKSYQYDINNPLNDTNIMNESRMFDENSELSDYLHEDSFFKNASMYIFHIDGPLRRFCLKLAEPKCEVDEVFRIRDRIPDYQIKVPLLADGHSEFLGMDEKSLKSYDISNKIFDRIVLTLIMISSAMLPLDNPLNDPNAKETKIIQQINIFFTLCFLTELSIKIIAKGVLQNNLGNIKPYLDSGWNRVDAFVVFISCLDLLFMIMNVGSNLAALKALRALRALRPLRVIKRFENLKLIINALFATLSAM